MFFSGTDIRRRRYAWARESVMCKRDMRRRELGLLCCVVTGRSRRPTLQR
jgi:hypothetical protein